MAKKRRSGFFRTLVWTSLLLAAGGILYVQFFTSRVRFKDKNYAYVYISRSATYEDVLSLLESEEIMKNKETFAWLAKKMDLDKNVHPGRYRITNGMNMRQIINLLKYNKQEKIKLSFNSQIHTLEEFVEYVDEKLDLTEEELEDLLKNDEVLRENFGLDPDNCFAMLVPGSFELSWAVPLDEFVATLRARYRRLWSSARQTQARRLGFSPPEIATIASIVQSESSIESEQEKIAGVYINRLKRNMPLQADPTLKFANRNFSAQRVLDADKEINSPYNTYKRRGLPPGPICLVSEQAIDATLNFSKHNFIYFCAKPALNGYSDFSKNYDEHLRYARNYQKNLNKIGISR